MLARTDWGHGAKTSEGHGRECVIVVYCSEIKENRADLQEFMEQITSVL